ncbi:fimbrial protein [Providencia stuartii]|uniref:fimbrial protein n=1 Tax=Providencia stuartii TaxID=588 RepID=UPI0015D9B6BD|nr:fimbrial protein [Providencia stuartii]
MNKMFVAFLFLFSSSSYSYICLNKYTGETFKNGDQIIEVPIDSDITQVENIFANVGEYLDCRNEIPNQYVDYLEIKRLGITLGNVLKSQGFSGGVYVNNSRYTENNLSRINVFTLTDGDYHPVDIDMFFKTPDPVGPYLVIERGDVLMTLRLYKYSDPFETEGDYVWTFISANRAILATGSCEINNNQLIDVDFGEVSKTAISTVGSQTRYQIEKELEYDCDDTSVNQNIKVSLSADTASFSNTAFSTTTPGLGVEMYHEGQVVAPFEGFNSNLRNGMGRDTVTFTLVKTPNPGPSDLQEGDFSANASLIISQP